MSDNDLDASRGCWVWRDGSFVARDKDEEKKKAIENPRHYVITDEMDPLVHAGDKRGIIFTSKAKHRAHTRALGLEEVGTEMPKDESEKIAAAKWAKTKREFMEVFKHLMGGGTIDMPPIPDTPAEMLEYLDKLEMRH